MHPLHRQNDFYHIGIQYLDRLDCLISNRCLEDMQCYLNGGKRRNLTARYTKSILGTYRIV